MEGAGKDGGQLRRRVIHIIYFLSRMGRIEQPHLIPVHHLNQNSVYLRDVKRWLSDLRGKDMPEAFSWSYKRRYKTGYVWQDLMDDELLTPISDNQYVLKGSEIIPFTPFEAALQGEKRDVEVEEKDLHDHPLPKQAIEKNSYSKLMINSYFSPEIYQESPQEDTTELDDESPQTRGDKYEDPSSFCTPVLDQKNKKGTKTKNKISYDNKKEGVILGTLSSPISSSSTTKTSYGKTKSHSNGARHIFRNLFSCGATGTNDAALVNRATETNPKHFDNSGDRTGEMSVKILKTPWNDQQKRRTARRTGFDEEKDCKNKQGAEFGSSNVVSAAAYMPVGRPICSQCGRSFKPDKMHKHMKSCKGTKALAKTTTAAAAIEKVALFRPVNSSHKEPSQAFFLAN